MRKKFTMLLVSLLACVGVMKAQYYVIESVGENITDLSALTEDTYVALYNVGKSKYIYEGTDNKLYMGTPAENDGHEYIWQVHKDGDYFLFTSASGRYFSTPLNDNDVYTVKSDNAAKDKFTITKHNEDDTKWKVKSSNNENIYWDAQDARFVGWQGMNQNSRYEIRPVTVAEISAEAYPLSQYITTNEEEIKWLHVKNVRSGKYAAYTGESTKMKQQAVDAATSTTFFYLTGKVDVNNNGMAVVRIHNYATENLCNEYQSWTANGRDWYIQQSNGQNIHPGWAISKNTNLDNREAWNNESGDGNFIAYWNGNDQGSTWEFVSADYNALMTTIQTLKNDLQPVIETGQEKLDENGYTATKVALTAGMLYCNAPYTATQNGDHLGVAALVDTNDDTYLHTDYSGANSADGEDHYIRIDLGEGNSAIYFTFNYKGRHNTGNNNPLIMVVEGSNTENGEYAEIATLTDLPAGQGVVYQSGCLSNGKAYRYLRFKVVDTHNHSAAGGHKFFSLAAFGLDIITVKEGLEIKTKAYANLAKAVAEAQSVVDKSNATEDDISNASDLISAILPGLVVTDYPFTLTQDAKNPVCYLIKSARSMSSNNQFGNPTYWSYQASGENASYFTVKEYGNENGDELAKQDISAYWYFVENDYGYLEMVPFIIPTSMGYTTVSGGVKKLTNNHSVQGFVNTTYSFVNDAHTKWEGYPYALKPYGYDTYVSNHSGRNNMMGFYNSVDDGGTRFNLIPVTTPSAKLRDLRSTIAEAQGYEGSTVLGEYTEASVATLNTALGTAQAVYDDATTATDETCQTQIDAITTAKGNLAVNLPQAGKFYRIMNNGGTGYLSTGTGTGRTQFVAGIGEHASSIFYYTGEKLVDYTTGLYLVKDGNNMLAYTNTVGEAAGTIISFAKSPVLGKLLISFDNGNRSFYSNAVGESNAASSGQTGEHYRFTVSEVTWLPIPMSTTVGYATLCSPVALSTYEYGSTTDHRVEAYVIHSTGADYVTLTRIDAEDGVIPANTPVILKYVPGATYDNEKGAVYLEVSKSEKVAIESKLEGTLADAYVAGPAYVLSAPTVETVGLYKAKLNKDGEGNAVEGEPGTHFLNNGFKAYLVVEGANAPMFSFGRGEGTTGIDNAQLTIDNVVIYDLLGRRVEKMEKGIYIVNGKKVIK